ncbi:MAG: DUF1786 family protein [Candidatus Rifleibacteriota bacterium]
MKKKENRDSQKFLLIDIGTGTRDIMLFSDSSALENNSKIVAPTASRMLAKQIENVKADLRIAGHTMGGGPLSSALNNHLKHGFKISIEPEAAFTVRNNLAQVEQLGFEVCPKIPNPDFFFDEIELPKLMKIFNDMGDSCENLINIGLSVQDHGDHAADQSARRQRFDNFIKLLGKTPDLRSLVFTPDTLPSMFSRMRSGVRCICRLIPDARIILMDTCISAIAGCIFDSRLKSFSGPNLFVNFGNGHTLACVIEGTRILAIYEHHTSMIKDQPGLINDHLKRLVEGNLSFEEVYESGGHGCKTFYPMSFNKLTSHIVTGPQRSISSRLLIDFFPAAPGGDMMMTGPLGLLRGFDLVKGDENEQIF